MIVTGWACRKLRHPHICPHCRGPGALSRQAPGESDAEGLGSWHSRWAVYPYCACIHSFKHIQLRRICLVSACHHTAPDVSCCQPMALQKPGS